MDLYVCWTTKQIPTPRPGGHPCANAHDALLAAGYTPNVIHARSFGAIPDALQTKARKQVKQQTGSSWVPAIHSDDGEWVSGTREIIEWAASHPVQA